MDAAIRGGIWLRLRGGIPLTQLFDQLLTADGSDEGLHSRAERVTRQSDVRSQCSIPPIRHTVLNTHSRPRTSSAALNALRTSSSGTSTGAACDQIRSISSIVQGMRLPRWRSSLAQYFEDQRRAPHAADLRFFVDAARVDAEELRRYADARLIAHRRHARTDGPSDHR